MITAQEALQRLKDGNSRFASDSPQTPPTDSNRRQELVAGQKPFAIVLACSDSRAPVETIFDQGLGDLFIVRVAGNIAAPTQIGSIEFAAEHFGSPLVVVLGHQNCGAVKATLAELKSPSGAPSPNLSSIIKHIVPAVENLADSGDDAEALLQHAVRANVRSAAAELRSQSELLDQFIADGRVTVVGAEYSLATGKVEFLDETA
mgnify:CR=1 FL=1